MWWTRPSMPSITGKTRSLISLPVSPLPTPITLSPVLPPWMAYQLGEAMAGERPVNGFNDGDGPSAGFDLNGQAEALPGALPADQE
jgi:hypothetical protein